MLHKAPLAIILKPFIYSVRLLSRNLMGQEVRYEQVDIMFYCIFNVHLANS